MPYRSTSLTRAKAETRRSELLEAARALVAEQGFAGATVAAIAARGGTSVGSVYSYFDHRDHLLADVFSSAAGHELFEVDRAVSAAGPSPVAQVEALVDTFARRALEGRQMAWSLLFEPVTPAIEEQRLAFRRAYRTLGERVIGAGVAQGHFVAQPVDVSASAVMGAISDALVGSLSPMSEDARHDRPTPDVVEHIRRFCLRALGADPHEGTARS